MFPDDLKPSQPYHHGDVKNALINAAMKLIDTNELEAMSLRRLAKEVGVTPSAVYNHFTDKDALMMAIKIRLYEDINRYFDSHYPESDDPEQTLLDMCYTYFHFSREFPTNSANGQCNQFRTSGQFRSSPDGSWNRLRL